MRPKLFIPDPIKSAIKAANDHNTSSFLSNFADTAILSDEGQEYRGIEAIRRWSDEKLIGANVTFEIIDIRTSGHNSVVTAEIDGDFDKTGLQDPFVMALHFATFGSKIERLEFRLPSV